MSPLLAQVGSLGKRPDVRPGSALDGATGRLLSVAELQQALRLALTTTGTTPLEHPPAPAGPGTQGTAPQGPAPVARPEHPPVPDRADTPLPDPGATEECGAPVPVRWGANPVPVGGVVGQRPVAVAQRVESSTPAAPVPGVARFPVADLLRRRPRDRVRETTRILTGRWPGARTVVFASLTGGAGRSTSAALLCAAAVDVRVPVLLLDATGDTGSDLAARVGATATRRDWTRLTGPDAGVDFAALRRRGGTGPGAAARVLAVSGDAGAPPPADAVAAGAAAAARSWPLVLVDIPHGRAAVRAAVRAGGVDLLVLVCRPDPAEIADSSQFLRELAGAGEWDCAQRAVLAVRADRRGLPAAARRGLAGVCDTATGPMTVAHVARLTGRRTAAQGPEAVTAGRLLTAAAAATTPLLTPLRTLGSTDR